ncbi:chromatin assembly factor 1 subunit p90 [Kluyveromyces marxianus DMKU3-1042]|uniref:Chromatin assembly factor 1 subunit p90 n=1 Tax=Kluyveromyces marxianus (strain DMKU3-1042 / BCC 29191 / NBRC 104275) TaxID=1003335 RepID=W0T7Z7_KLUMD|nr:chromatin assembly factor 1 subunit p90 [Kluyveromyces marxianus DMKU3-1042]BAO38219.1 chromatin assembly factor 1 subunit p90 [Kluyveromyces marxianus DMKU3-1042]
MSATASPVSGPKKHGILSFFQNTAKSEKRAEESDTKGDGESQEAAIQIEEDSDKADPIESADELNEDSQRSTSTAEKGNETEVDDKENNYKENNKNNDDADLTQDNKKAERALRREKSKELNLKKKEQERIERENKKLEEKQKREKQKQEREAKKLQEREERERRKQQEKEERERKKRQEKEERERKKQQEKEEKEQERLKKEEDKRKKEEEKRKKEEEKRKKEEAKERTQSRIGNFFKKASSKQTDEVEVSDFEKYFLPFYVKSGVVMVNSYNSTTSEDLESKVKDIDQLLESNDTSSSIEWLHSHNQKHGYEIKMTAVEVLQTMTAKKKSDEELSKLLDKVPQKFIKFYENVRPPYVGTFSKKLTLPRDNPFSTEGTGFDYGYDSDLDWVNEEEEEGGVDDLENDDEDEEEEQDDEDDGENEMDGFLDKDDDETGVSRKKFVGPLIPTIKLRKDLSTLDEESQKYFALVSVECLYQDAEFPVDPFKPLNKRVATETPDQPEQKSSSTTPNKKTKSLITEPQDIVKLLEQVHDSTFSLSTITEIVQKHLPHYKKDTIKNSIKEYAAKSTKGDRKWQVKDMESWEELKKLPSGPIKTELSSVQT